MLFSRQVRDALEGGLCLFVVDALSEPLASLLKVGACEQGPVLLRVAQHTLVQVGDAGIAQRCGEFGLGQSGFPADGSQPNVHDHVNVVVDRLLDQVVNGPALVAERTDVQSGLRDSPSVGALDEVITRDGQRLRYVSDGEDTRVGHMSLLDLHQGVPRHS